MTGEPPGDDPLYQPTREAPLRLLVVGAAEPAWYQADDELRQRTVLPALVACLERWRRWGAHLIGTFDDDLLMAGTPRSRDASFYLLYEADGLDLATAMVNLVRTEVDGVRLDRYFRLEVLVGRSFFPAE